MRALRLAVIASAVGATLACAQKPALNKSANTDAEVYRGYLNERHVPPADSLYVAESTLVYHPSKGALIDNTGLSYGLQNALAAASSMRRTTVSLSVPYRLRVLTNPELRRILGPNPRIGWDRFHEIFPNTKSFWGFSPIAYSENGNESLFYAENHCGPLCGTGELVWSTRDSTGHWTVRKVIGLWIS